MWSHVIYTDSDAIIRASLDDLTAIKGFVAPNHKYLKSPKNVFETQLSMQFVDVNEENRQLFDRLNAKYNLKAPCFIRSLFVFSTDIIQKDTFKKLKGLFKEYHKLHHWCDAGDQSTLNLLFHNQWQELPYVYNVHPKCTEEYFHISRRSVEAIIVHFACEFPWKPDHEFYPEWKNNFDKSDEIDITMRQPNCKKWSQLEIKTYRLYLEIRRWITLGWLYLIIRRMVKLVK